ncbi:Succinate--CoA ligase [GDP-forming] subunit beta, mitochondrial, partial [Anabarilius grahami]
LVRVSPRRWLNLQEYQSKKLMQDSGVTVQRFFVADTASEALEAAKRLSCGTNDPTPAPKVGPVFGTDGRGAAHFKQPPVPLSNLTVKEASLMLPSSVTNRHSIMQLCLLPKHTHVHINTHKRNNKREDER